jgi:hypothetical protein
MKITLTHAIRTVNILCLSALAHLRGEPMSAREQAARIVQDSLKGQVDMTTLHLAQARAQRHIAHGRTAQEAGHIAVTWARSTRAPAWAEPRFKCR